VVFLHCVQAISRTPTIAALYSARHLGIPIEAALADVRSVLPLAHPNPTFTAALRSHDLDGSLR
jgi:ADP-ribosyl-[dinitrogen reductase] hydrolase